MRSFIKSMLIPCITLALSALALQACSGDQGTGTSNTTGCVKNSTQRCTCNGTDTGVQTCQADGSYNACTCSQGTGGAGGGTSSSSGTGGMANCHDLPGVPKTCGNGTVDPGETCDDMNCNNDDGCTVKCAAPSCGDGVITAPELCDSVNAECVNCGLPGASSSSSASSSSGVCMGQEVFLGLSPAQIGAFSGAGLFGLDAANALCQNMGANQMCDYVQWEQLQNNPAMYPASITNLAAAIGVGNCQKIWLQRTTAVGANLPGPGGRCNNWNYGTDHEADGEFIEVCNMAGTLTYNVTLDPDTIYQAGMNAPHQNPGIPCNAMRAIPCCYKTCIP